MFVVSFHMTEYIFATPTKHIIAQEKLHFLLLSDHLFQFVYSLYLPNDEAKITHFVIKFDWKARKWERFSSKARIPI